MFTRTVLINILQQLEQLRKEIIGAALILRMVPLQQHHQRCFFLVKETRKCVEPVCFHGTADIKETSIDPGFFAGFHPADIVFPDRNRLQGLFVQFFFHPLPDLELPDMEAKSIDDRDSY